ncbi:MAG: glutamine-hydrolyzing carbamoyl-phosphate synthase small subunit [Chloroflexi bacterium]|nr:glutamine-hydrolyzing carbamoyl-phosphate synthase small subunit [Chloroflexota bacterium]
MPNRIKAMLVLEDGSTYPGYSVGAEGEWVGQAVFNTSVTGYQEIITDPACKGQMVVLTNPHVGNAGVNAADVESDGPQVCAVLARKLCPRPSNWRAEGSLPDYMRKHGAAAIDGLDTRGLTLRLRSSGPQRAALSTRNLDPQRLLQLARSASLPATWPAHAPAAPATLRFDRVWLAEMKEHLATGRAAARVVLIDCGGKLNLLRHLELMGAQVTVLPAASSLDELLAAQPQGVIVSGGPGDPNQAAEGLALVRALVARHTNAPACEFAPGQTAARVATGPGLPLFGVGLGMQLIALALGARVVPLPVGHRADNVPVLDVATGRIEITAHNHSYAVDPASLARLPLDVTHTNLNDRSIEGLRHRDWPIAGVQFQPEASPGPHDSLHLLYEFVTQLTERAPHA